MTEQPADDPFLDCKLNPKAILGTHTFEDVGSVEILSK
jgi:hypothetical protein